MKEKTLKTSPNIEYILFAKLVVPRLQSSFFYSAKNLYRYYYNK